MSGLFEIEVKRGKDGVFFARPYLGTDPISGRVIRPYKRFPEAQDVAEAQRMAEEWARGYSASAGMHVGNTVGEIAERYIKAMKARGASPNTVRTYNSALRCFVRPAIGRMTPAEVQPYVVEDLYTMMLTDGACGRAPVASGTVRKIHGFLKGLWRWMRRQGLVEVDVMASVTAPARDAHEAVAFSSKQVARIQRELDRIDADPDAPFFDKSAAFASHLSLWTGVRVGEACAVVRRDINAGRRMLHVCANAVEDARGVERRPKTKGKRSRNVSLPEGVCERVERHYEWQSEHLAKGVLVGSNTPVCCDERGGLLRPSSVSRWFSAMRDRLGLPKEASFHSLRHTHATTLLMMGMDLKTIAERLGHARETLTLETYSHVMPGRDQAAGEMFAEFALGLPSEEDQEVSSCE